MPVDSRIGTFKYLNTAPADGFFQETTGSWAHLAATASTAGAMTLWRDGATRDDGAWTEEDGIAASKEAIHHRLHSTFTSHLGPARLTESQSAFVATTPK